MKNKTILIPVSQGFAIRYLLQTDIFSHLQKSGNLLVIVTQNPEDRFFREFKKHANVKVEPYEMEKCNQFHKRSKIGAILKQASFFIQNGRYNIKTVLDLYQAWLKDIKTSKRGLKFKIVYLLIHILVILGRKSRIIRNSILWLEQFFFFTEPAQGGIRSL